MMKAATAAPATQGGQCHCTQLRKASRRISQLYDLALAPSGLKTTQRALLAHIRRMQPTTVKALAEALVMDPGALAHTLKPLTRDALVAIGVHPEDRRNKSISLTPEGLARLQQSDALWAAAEKSFEAGFGTQQSQALRDAMQLLISPQFTEIFETALATSQAPPA
jgi:DNA-binding MarR family transcriptional regulator